ncbi:hypothetical protein [Cryobacterium sp. M15]|jgi:hypothetical protein|uniref:hypothetical protein n=1 Tax=Cryobacterium sp. M15 TaxID=2048291 RepID=UPI0013048AF4|nr:hypothetical protein [Cryobacterium sp. M15]
MNSPFPLRAAFHVKLLASGLEEETLRSSFRMLGNPWPRDMVITVDDDADTLVDLLWIRETWNLQSISADFPPLLSDDSVRAHARTETSDAAKTWLDAWPVIWNACIHHAGLLQDSTIFAQLRQTTDGSPERADLLARLVGPSWSGSFGDDAFTAEYETWNLARFQARTQRHPLSVGNDPERLSLQALIPAWRTGLSKIVTIPCQGSYTRVIGQHTLLVTDETRDDHQRYSEALKQFR